MTDESTFHFGSWLAREIQLTGMSLKKFSDASGIRAVQLRAWIKLASPAVGRNYLSRLSVAIGVTEKKIQGLLAKASGKPDQSIELADTTTPVAVGNKSEDCAIEALHETSSSGKWLLTFVDRSKLYDRFPLTFGTAKASKLLTFEQEHGVGSLVTALKKFVDAKLETK